MHNEHKTLKWCAVVLTFIIAVATFAGMWFLPVPGILMLPEEGPAVTRMPDEMPSVTEKSDLKQYREGKPEAVKSEATREADTETVRVTVQADEMEMNLMTADVTVGEMLDAYGIPVGKDDIVKPAVDKQLTDGTTVKITRIIFAEIVETEVIPFKTKVEGTDELPAKTQKVVQKGKNGEDEVTYKVTYADGKEVARKEIARKTITKPVKKVILKSTVGTINGAEYARKFTVKAYSYTGGGTTASGLPAAVGRIAVDPRVIPLGTRVYVEGYGFATAADTGGNIKGNTIDVYYNSESQCRSWGCRYITIYILK